MIVRCTSKLTQLLKLGRLADTPQDDDDWCVNVATIARKRVVLAIHAGTLFPIVAVGTSVATMRDLPGWLAAEVRAALLDEGLSEHQLGSLDVTHALLARTSSRKVLGHLTQLAFEVEYSVAAAGGWDHEDLEELNRALRRGLRGRDGGYVVPLELARERMVNPANDALLAQFRAGLVGLSAAELTGLASTLLDIGAQQVKTQARTKPAPRSTEILRLTASIDGADPPITRTLEVPADLDLERLHLLLQRAFKWQNRHLYRFARSCSVWDNDGELYLCDFDISEGDTTGTPVRQARLAEVLNAPGDQMTYLYDYGDNWQITISLDLVAEGSASETAIIDGTGAAPPEDAGGIHTWNDERAQSPTLVRYTHQRETLSLRRLARLRGRGRT